MKIATDGLRIEGLNKGEIVDFSRVRTVEQLKEKIINCYIFFCKKCSARIRQNCQKKLKSFRPYRWTGQYCPICHGV